MSEQDAKLVEATVEDALQVLEEKGSRPSVEDMAAWDYQNTLPLFVKKLEELNTRSLRKVIAAILEYPLASQQFRWSYQPEKEAFNMGMKISDCKHVIMRACLEMKKEEINKLLNETSTAQDVGTLEAKPTEGVE